MNTATERTTPILPLTGGYVFVLEDLELAFPKDQLKKITKQWNQGKDIRAIASNFQREPDEVFLALFHQSRKSLIKRKFAEENGSSLLVSGKDQLKNSEKRGVIKC